MLKWALENPKLTAVLAGVAIIAGAFTVIKLSNQRYVFIFEKGRIEFRPV